MLVRKLLFILFGFFVVVGLGFIAINPKAAKFAGDTIDITSPLPDFLGSNFPKVLAAGQYWKPDVELVVQSSIAKPDLTATSVISYDLTDNRTLYAREAKVRVPMASLTKIMTAIVALENYELKQKFEVTTSAATVGENAMGLTAGEILNLEDLLYGLMLNSGNDAAETIAQGGSFGRDNFVYMMNKRAEDLGLSDTHFTNPSGLEGDGNQYTTAADLLTMTRYALQNPDFARIVATYQYDIQANTEHREYNLYNETNLLTTYPGVKGVKTGYTYEAGLCLVTYLEHNGQKIIAILLNAQNRRQEMKDLLDYSLKIQGIKPPPHS